MKSYVTSSIFGDSLKEVYGDDAIGSEKDLIINQRFIKLCRLPQLGVYVDEAHHLYGNKLDKALYDKSKKTSLRSTINLLSVELDRNDTKLVACYNYTGTPYVKNKVLPEVVYSYGLAESISNGYLKKAERLGFENVKSEEFLRAVIKDFWDKYGGKTYEGLAPKLAIFSSTHKELLEEVYPVVEEVLENLDISRTKILVNIGDTKRTKAEDIRDFNNLDVPDTAGAEKQFILLVDKGREGWDCRSLFGVALYRKPKSRIFVLQATMRCLRKITDIQQEATIYLSKENMDILEKELQQNYRASLDDLKGKKSDKKSFEVRVVPPKRYINLKVLKHKYYLEEKKKSDYIDFELDTLNVEKYQSNIYRQYSMTLELTTKKENVDHLQEKKRYSELTLTAELSRYLNLSCININKILHDSVDGIEKVIEYVNKYNEILYDVIVHKIFNSFFKVKYEIVSEDRDVLLLREPKDKEYYSFSAKPELVKRNTDSDMKEFADKAFHADTYCFDSKPEKELFLQYLVSDEVEEVYFTGMFTGNQGDLHIQYYDPESQRIRNYYPDFYVKMKDGSSQIVEVKADHMIDNDVVMAKTDAANELVCESNMDYKIYPSSTVIESNVLDSNKESKDKQIHFDV